MSNNTHLEESGSATIEQIVDHINEENIVERMLEGIEGSEKYSYMRGLTESQIEIYNLLKDIANDKREGVTPKELMQEMDKRNIDYAARTVRYALRILKDKHLVKTIYNLMDMRQKKVVINTPKEVYRQYTESISR